MDRIVECQRQARFWHEQAVMDLAEGLLDGAAYCQRMSAANAADALSMLRTLIQKGRL